MLPSQGAYIFLWLFVGGGHILKNGMLTKGCYSMRSIFGNAPQFYFFSFDTCLRNFLFFIFFGVGLYT
jgi:hypothetical protein